VTVEFEHPDFHHEPVTLRAGDYIGDLCILGKDDRVLNDWASSTCFQFPPTDTDERTEIRVKTDHDYVVVLELQVPQKEPYRLQVPQKEPYRLRENSENRPSESRRALVKRPSCSSRFLKERKEPYYKERKSPTNNKRARQAHAFQNALSSGSLINKDAVQTFLEDWMVP
jgi:hypothetical protein